jgi:chaperonin cofactor prefoldin
MSLIPVSNDKPSNLNTQLALHKERASHLETRIERLEKKFEDSEEQNQQTKRVIIGSLISIATGILTTVVAILIRK